MILLVLGKGQRCSEVLIDVVAGVVHVVWVHGVLECSHVM